MKTKEPNEEPKQGGPNKKKETENTTDKNTGTAKRPEKPNGDTESEERNERITNREKNVTNKDEDNKVTNKDTGTEEGETQGERRNEQRKELSSDVRNTPDKPDSNEEQEIRKKIHSSRGNDSHAEPMK